jgi:hypothetical protein
MRRLSDLALFTVALVLVLAAFLLAGCDEDPTLKVHFVGSWGSQFPEPQSLRLTTANGEHWSVEGFCSCADNLWYSVSPMNGESGSKITFTPDNSMIADKLGPGDYVDLLVLKAEKSDLMRVVVVQLSLQDDPGSLPATFITPEPNPPPTPRHDFDRSAFNPQYPRPGVRSLSLRTIRGSESNRVALAQIMR